MALSAQAGYIMLTLLCVMSSWDISHTRRHAEDSFYSYFQNASGGPGAAGNCP